MLSLLCRRTTVINETAQYIDNRSMEPEGENHHDEHKRV
jgi:hypothetical protein